VEEMTDEPLYRDRVCGIDIGKAGMVATIRVPSDKNPARRASETRSFGTTRREVLALADWLRCWQVTAVVMEATGDYWKGPFYRLEAEGFECVLADARQVKNLPGRPKRDPADSRWLAACFERGAITSCFVATPEFRIIRLHTRYRRDLTEERTRLGLTQTEVAHRMGVPQDQVAAIERADPGTTDVRTLVSYIEALGGRLTLTADFGGDRIVLH